MNFNLEPSLDSKASMNTRRLLICIACVAKPRSINETMYAELDLDSAPQLKIYAVARSPFNALLFKPLGILTSTSNVSLNPITAGIELPIAGLSAPEAMNGGFKNSTINSVGNFGIVVFTSILGLLPAIMIFPLPVRVAVE